MSALDEFEFSLEHMVKMRPHPAVDEKLSRKTRNFLHNVGLRNSDEFDFVFTGETILFPNQVVGFEDLIPGKLVCLDIRQGEIIRWQDAGTDGFINSSVEQFAQCVEVFDNYLHNIQYKEVFDSFRSNNEIRSNRTPYVEYITKELKAIDPIVFEKGYYWPAFIEDIEIG